ncbi:MAG: hypothetical protein JWN70_6480 [Planctomycetaceae bacterium]|nr:hypothetical protein [Planctomycetaceae bacterium]
MNNTYLLLSAAIAAGLYFLWAVGSFLQRWSRLPNELVISTFEHWALHSLDVDVDTSRLERTWIEVNGIPICISVLAQDFPTPTILFVPGTSAYSEIYVEFLFALHARGFNVVGYDPRGHGRSGGPRGDFIFEELWRDAVEIGRHARNRFGGKIAICGTSQGGLTAFYAVSGSKVFAAAACNNIADLNAHDNLILSKFRPPRWAVPGLIWLFRKPLARLVIPLSIYLDFNSQRLINGSDASTFLSQAPLAVVFYTLRVLGSLALTPLPKPIEQMTEIPILVFQGENDSVFPLSYTRSVYAQLRCPKELVVFPGMEHLVLTNNVSEIIEPITAWLHRVLGEGDRTTDASRP